MSAAGERIQGLIDTAERVASEIQAEARAEAQKYAEARRREADESAEERVSQLQALADPLIERVEDVRRLADQLAMELTNAVEEARDLIGSRETEQPAPRAVAPVPSPSPRPTGPAPVAYPGRNRLTQSERSGGSSADVPEDALLRATQLAVSGSSRDEIVEVLRKEFHLDDPRSVADEILGQADTG